MPAVVQGGITMAGLDLDHAATRPDAGQTVPGRAPRTGDPGRSPRWRVALARDPGHGAV